MPTKEMIDADKRNLLIKVALLFFRAICYEQGRLNPIEA